MTSLKQPVCLAVGRTAVCLERRLVIIYTETELYIWLRRNVKCLDQVISLTSYLMHDQFLQKFLQSDYI